jgi:hypothetical protein
LAQRKALDQPASSASHGREHRSLGASLTTERSPSDHSSIALRSPIDRFNDST